MRFFFPLELELFLDRAGFSLLELKAFPDFNRRSRPVDLERPRSCARGLTGVT